MTEKSESSFRKLAMMIETRVRRFPDCPIESCCIALKAVSNFDKNLVYNNKPSVFNWESRARVWI